MTDDQEARINELESYRELCRQADCGLIVQERDQLKEQNAILVSALQRIVDGRDMQLDEPIAREALEQSETLAKLK